MQFLQYPDGLWIYSVYSQSIILWIIILHKHGHFWVRWVGIQTKRAQGLFEWPASQVRTMIAQPGAVEVYMAVPERWGAQGIPGDAVRPIAPKKGPRKASCPRSFPCDFHGFSMIFMDFQNLASRITYGPKSRECICWT